MEIPNLSNTPNVDKPIVINKTAKSSNTLIFSIIVVALALIFGFGMSRLLLSPIILKMKSFYPPIRLVVPMI